MRADALVPPRPLPPTAFFVCLWCPLSSAQSQALRLMLGVPASDNAPERGAALPLSGRGATGQPGCLPGWLLGHAAPQFPPYLLTRRYAMECYTVTFTLETPKTIKLDVHAQTEEEAIQRVTPWAHDIAKCVDAPLQVGRVLCVEKITT